MLVKSRKNPIPSSLVGSVGCSESLKSNDFCTPFDHALALLYIQATPPKANACTSLPLTFPYTLATLRRPAPLYHFFKHLSMPF